MLSESLVLYEPVDPISRAQAWAAYSTAERRRRAVAACQERDRQALMELLAGYVLAKSRSRSQASVHTLESYAQTLDTLLVLWHEEQILHPSPDAGDRFAGALSRAGNRPATVAVRLAGAKAFYRALRWCRATEADPFADVKPPRDPTPRHERRYPYSDSDVEALLQQAGPQDRALVLLCAHGGLRIAEALALTWSDVDSARGALRVALGKGRKSRTVHLSESLRQALDAIRPHPSVGPVVRTADGLSYADPTVPRRHLQRLCARAGVQYLGFHSLRHSAGTRLARQTGDLQLVAAHLGHADVSTASIYAKWSDDSLQGAIRGW